MLRNLLKRRGTTPIEAMEIEVLCSELEWERPSPARDTTIEELWFPGES